MKLLRFGIPGEEKPGLYTDDGRILDLSAHVADLGATNLTPSVLAAIAALDQNDLPVITPERIGPCVANVGKFICVGLNYADHAAETGATIPSEPIIFMKATSAIIGPDDDVVLPRGSTKSDWEVELGIVIGSRASYVSEDDALHHIAGYCVINDLSEREYQFEREGTWDKGKGCDTFGPIGPWLVTTDEIPEPTRLRLWLDVNGTRFQDGSTATMVYGPAFLVSYISQFMTLHPGDIISTGTPPGVGLGQKPPRFLQAGDVMELGIEGLGTQRQRVCSQSS